MTDETTLNAVELAADITIAWLGNQHNRISADEAPAFLRTMYAAVSALAGSTSPADATLDTADNRSFTPAVTVRKSLASRDHIISLIDGKPYRMLRRHLATHGLTPEQYRQRYNLKADYPMVAEAYSEARSQWAKKIGLGQQGRAAKAAPAAPTPVKPRRAGRLSPNFG